MRMRRRMIQWRRGKGEEEEEEEEEGGGRGRRSHAAMLCHTAGSASPRIRPAARKRPLSCSKEARAGVQHCTGISAALIGFGHEG